MKLHKLVQYLIVTLLCGVIVVGCKMPPPKQEAAARPRHNYIVLLDLSDRLIVQDNQPERDKQIVKQLYTLFEDQVRQNMYIKSGDEIRVVIAPQLGAGLRRDVFEDRLYVNMENIKAVYRKPREVDRREAFFANLDTLYNKAVFSSNTKDYHGADIWKYFYEDLPVDYDKDPNTINYLFILTDGYPIVGHNRNKLLEIRNEFPDLQIVLLEAAPREKDMEWDHVMSIWDDWFRDIGIQKYTLIKRGSITKELEQVKEIVQDPPRTLAKR